MVPKRVSYDKSKILAVTKDGLEYIDDQGSKCAIDFHACRENLERELGSAGYLRIRHPADVYVGFRDLGAKPPYITFATEPPTRFEFPMPKPLVKVAGKKFLQSDPEDFREFREFQARLMEVGLKTLDMA